MWKIFSVPCGSALYKFHCNMMILNWDVAGRGRGLTIFPKTITRSVGIRGKICYCNLLSGQIHGIPENGTGMVITEMKRFY
jgi:hypothetical protein